MSIRSSVAVILICGFTSLSQELPDGGWKVFERWGPQNELQHAARKQTNPEVL